MLTEKAKSIGQFAVAFGLVYLASAMLYLTSEVSSARHQLPGLLADVSTLNSELSQGSSINRIGRALDSIPTVASEMAEFRQLIPAILAEAEAARNSIPPVLAESEAIRMTLPAVFLELEEIRNALDPVLVELASLREETPVIIKNARELVKETSVASERIADKAAQGAVEGTVKGIIRAPFGVIKSGADLVTHKKGEE